MKKIFILSGREDPTTDDVLDWLLHLKPNVKFVRVSDDDRILINSIRISETIQFSLLIEYQDGQTEIVNSDEISSYWYRRGALTLKYQLFTPSNSFEASFLKSLYDFSNREGKYVTDLLHNILSYDRPSINHANDNVTNKLNNQRVAVQCGLKVPDTLITSSRKELKAFCKRHNKLISKPIRNFEARFDYDDKTIKYGDTTRLYTANELLKNNTDIFHPTLFQEYVEKKYEIRSFYLNGSFYTMAIFSQANEKTKVDYRNYDNSRPNRNVPYSLPKEIESSMHKLMRCININSGSFDLIYTPEDDYVFLEVNPIGQFQNLSHACNYDIERQIAKTLIDGL